MGFVSRKLKYGNNEKFQSIFICYEGDWRPAAF